MLPLLLSAASSLLFLFSLPAAASISTVTGDSMEFAINLTAPSPTIASGARPLNVSTKIQFVPKVLSPQTHKQGAIVRHDDETNCTGRPLEASQMLDLSPFWYKTMALITTIGLLVSLTSNMIIIYLFAW